MHIVYKAVTVNFQSPRHHMKYKIGIENKKIVTIQEYML